MTDSFNYMDPELRPVLAEDHHEAKVSYKQFLSIVSKRAGSKGPHINDLIYEIRPDILWHYAMFHIPDSEDRLRNKHLVPFVLSFPAIIYTIAALYSASNFDYGPLTASCVMWLILIATFLFIRRKQRIIYTVKNVIFGKNARWIFNHSDVALVIMGISKVLEMEDLPIEYRKQVVALRNDIADKARICYAKMSNLEKCAPLAGSNEDEERNRKVCDVMMGLGSAIDAYQNYSSNTLEIRLSHIVPV